MSEIKDIHEAVSLFDAIDDTFIHKHLWFISYRKTDASPEPGMVRTASNQVDGTYTEPRSR